MPAAFVSLGHDRVDSRRPRGSYFGDGRDLRHDFRASRAGGLHPRAGIAPGETIDRHTLFQADRECRLIESPEDMVDAERLVNQPRPCRPEERA